MRAPQGPRLSRTASGGPLRLQLPFRCARPSLQADDEADVETRNCASGYWQQLVPHAKRCITMSGTFRPLILPPPLCLLYTMSFA